MPSHSPRGRGLGVSRRRLVPAVAALIAAAAVAAPASAGATTIVVSGDSVLVTSMPSFGNGTVTATRPDALTGAPVVIGLFSGMANPLGPFSVNTTTPTPLSPAGDCWQKGALQQALTPDLQPGDTVTVSQTAFFGSGPSSATATVPSGDPTTPGPISGCSGVAPWARNAVTSAPGSVSDGGIAVSGVAQPLATGVSVTASDGKHTTPAATATPASDGSWSAKIPAAQVAKLADTTLTVTPVMAVPDVSTGSPAHIAGVGVDVTKSATVSGAPGSSPTGSTGPTQPAGSGHGGATTKGRTTARVSGLRVASTMTLVRARGLGIAASFVVPAGVSVVQVELLNHQGGVVSVRLPASTAGSRQTVRLHGARLRHLLRTGQYTVSVQVAAPSSALGPRTTRTLRIS